MGRRPVASMNTQHNLPAQFQQANRRLGAIWPRSCSGQMSARRPMAALARAFCLSLLVALAAPATANAASGFKICNDQTYALCAVASCFVLNGLSYCKCDVKNGDSISLPFNYSGGDVCDINAAGVGNGYMLSTYSVPPRARAG